MSKALFLTRVIFDVAGAAAVGYAMLVAVTAIPDLVRYIHLRRI